MADNKDIIKKLFKIAEAQQKIIIKMAQAAETEEQKKARWESERDALKMDGMFYYGKLSEDNPYRGDPFFGGDAPTNPTTGPNTMKPTPAHTDAAVGKIVDRKPAPKPVDRDIARPIAGATSTPILPSNLQVALDKGAPGLKGALNVKVNGKSLDVTYNADYVKGKLGLSPNDVKRVLTNALAPIYEITNVIGYNNPDPASWKPNYS